MSLKAVLFDFGGVLVRTRSQHLRSEWEARLGLPAGGASAVVFGSPSSREAQHGRITDVQHWQWIAGQLGLDPASLADFRRDFFAEDILDTDLLAYVDRLRAAGYHVALLSNAADNARQVFADSYRVAAHFDSITVSAEEGVMKPAPRIFEVALARAGCRPEEAVFVDDFIENVEAARVLGIIAVHFRDAESTLRELRTLTGVE